MVSILVAATLILVSFSAQSRVTRIVIDETVPLPAAASGGIAFEQVTGRAFGELDPKLPGNALIQDIELAKDADGKVRYVASFVLTKPVDMNKASSLMRHEVPNRGLRRPNAVQERAFGDYRPAQCLAGRRLGQYRRACHRRSRAAALAEAARCQTARRLRRHGRRARPHRQPQRPRFAAVDRADQPSAV